MYNLGVIENFLIVMAQVNNQNEIDARDEASEASANRVGQFNEGRRQAEINQEEENSARIKKEEETFKEMQPNAVNKATSELLKAAWENLITSWGLTLIWIDIHIFSGMVVGNKLFCKLGMEWVPDALKQTRFKEAEKLGKVVGAAEALGVAGLNLGCLFIVLGALMIIGVMLKVITNPIEFLGAISGYIWDKAVTWIGFK